MIDRKRSATLMPVDAASLVYLSGETPWEIDAPQPALEALAAQEKLVGDVLDIGCGTGEVALMLAARGHTVWAIDHSQEAIRRARAKAQDRELDVTFVRGNVLELTVLGQQFDTIIDCNFFPTLPREAYPAYLAGLAHVMYPHARLYLLVPELSAKMIAPIFAHGWKLHKSLKSTYLTRAGEQSAMLMSFEWLGSENA
jgi:ubiquinone/menaquinone biosynthesis C-methylase UbiE